MRPAVYASVVRNRKSGARPLRPPQFSIRRLLVMVFIGALLLAPGLIFTVLGADSDTNNLSISPASRVLYKVIGPVALAIGIFILFSALLYYFCYGLADHSTRQRHSSSKSNTSNQGQTSVRSNKSCERASEKAWPYCDSISSTTTARHNSHSSHHKRPPSNIHEEEDGIGNV
ncbi:hypothetical protein FSP39_006360 [Pinctada imbricata]|uniref:Uncharacterized protein n=1 Tax=Pinctada imbricata TaxID=66713 RepID=A0AA88XQF8_PINIB|nr:hypothetical protein FSP39_006360 [Pinctada imbricata]